MGGVHEVYNCSGGIVQRPNIDAVGPQDEEVGLLAGGQPADLAIEIGASRALDGGKLEQLPARQKRRQVLLAAASALQHEMSS